ncbi:unnamed protein product [Orchesella dallaii]|uniref:Peptidase aspartic putative domain-containing protein n=1 Tax=Orchesella dallaii TaxID=48710 RepID=A0ABP1QIJ0_9HEXA
MPYFTRQTTRNGELLNGLMQESLQAIGDTQPLPNRPVEVSAPRDEIPAEWLIRDAGQAGVLPDNVEFERDSINTVRDNVSQRSRKTSSSAKTTKSQKMRRELEKAKTLDELRRKSEDILKNQFQREKELQEKESARAKAIEELQRKEEQILQDQIRRQEDLVNAEFDLIEEEDEDGHSLASSENVFEKNPLGKFVKLTEPVNEKVADWLLSAKPHELNQDSWMNTPVLPPGATDTTCQPSQALNALAEAITTAITLASSKRTQEESPNMSKFLARQSTGKDLPTFSGEPEEWQYFHSVLKKSTEVCGFSEEENIGRLQKCLKGKAKEAVQSMLVSSCSLNEIVEVLQKRFGRPQVIIRAMVEKAQKTTIPTEEDPDSLVDFAIVVKNLCSSAETLGFPQYLYNPQLLTKLVMKLPAHLKMEWARSVSSIPEASISLKHLCTFLDDVSTAMAKISTPSSDNWREKRRDPVEDHKRESSYSSQEFRRRCIAGCDNRHDLGACKKFERMSVDERWVLAKRHAICFCCLRKGHQLQTCDLQLKCKIAGCNKFHHTLLHYEDKRENSPEFSGHVSRLPYNEVLMRVMPVRLYGLSGSCVEVNAFLDEGSSVSMVDADLAIRLGLKGKRAPLNLSWIDGRMNADSESRSVSLKISGMSADEPMEKKYLLKDVRTVKNLRLPSQPLEAFNMRKQWKHLELIPFLNVNKNPPLILLGQDNIQLSAPREIVEGAEGEPIATLTKLGWVVHGKVAVSGPESQGSFSVFNKRSGVGDVYEEDLRLKASDEWFNHTISSAVYGRSLVEEGNWSSNG